MKKFIFLSLIVVATLAMTSCTNDTADELQIPQTTQDDTGGQNGGIKPPPPPGP